MDIQETGGLLMTELTSAQEDQMLEQGLEDIRLRKVEKEIQDDILESYEEDLAQEELKYLEDLEPIKDEDDTEDAD